MSILLQILGRAINVDTAELIWHWLNEVRPLQVSGESSQEQQLDEIFSILAGRKLEAAQEQLRL